MHNKQLLSFNLITGASELVTYYQDRISTVYSWVNYFNGSSALYKSPYRLYYIS